MLLTQLSANVNNTWGAALPLLGDGRRPKNPLFTMTITDEIVAPRSVFATVGRPWWHTFPAVVLVVGRLSGRHQVPERT